MENEYLVILQKDSKTITKNDLQDLLIILAHGYLHDNVIINREHLMEIVKVALKNFPNWDENI